MTALPQKQFSPLMKSALGGWFALAAVFTAYILLGSRDPQFAPEIGPAGAFVFFGGILSIFYILDFLMIVVPYFLVFHRRFRLNPVKRGICGTALFCLSVPILIFATGTSPQNIPRFMAFAAVAGASSFILLRSSVVTPKVFGHRPSEAEHAADCNPH